MDVDDDATTVPDDEFDVSAFGDDSAEQQPLVCSACLCRVMRASAFLLQSTTSWCGALHGQCFRCSDFNPKAPAAEPVDEGEQPVEPQVDDESKGDAEDAAQRKKFKREANRRWSKRSGELKAKATRVRTAKFSNLMEIVSGMCPGLGHKELRVLAVRRIQAAVSAFVAGLFAMKGLAEAAKWACKKYLDDVTKEAEKVTWCPSADGRTLTAVEGQWLDSLTESLHVLYMCRQADCRFAARSRDWVRHKARAWYACPKCFCKYRPFTTSGNRVEGQRAIVLRDPASADAGWALFQASWPSSAEDSWITSMCEAYARDVSVPGNLQAFLTGQAVKLSDLLANVATKVPGGLQHHRLPPNVAQLCDGSVWSWAHIAESGFYGTVVPEGPVFREWDVMIGCIGNMLAGTASLRAAL